MCFIVDVSYQYSESVFDSSFRVFRQLVRNFWVSFGYAKASHDVFQLFEASLKLVNLFCDRKFFDETILEYFAPK